MARARWDFAAVALVWASLACELMGGVIVSAQPPSMTAEFDFSITTNNEWVVSASSQQLCCCGGTFTLSGLRGWPDKTAQAAWTTQPTPQDATPYASNSVQVVCPYVTDEGCGIVFQVDTYCSSGHCSFNSQNVQAVVLCKITPGIAPPFCEVVSPAAGVPTQDSLPFFGATVTNSFYETDYSATVMVQLWGYDQGRKV